MSLAVWLLRFFAPSNHSIRKSSPSSSRTTDSRIAMTSRIMNPRIFAIHSRVGQRKVPRPHASVFILPRSPSTSDPSLPPCRRSFISAKFSFICRTQKVPRMEPEHTHSSFMECLPLCVSFHTPHCVIFHSPRPSFSSRDGVYFIFAAYFAPSLLTVSRLQCSGEFSNGSRMFSTRAFHA